MLAASINLDLAKPSGNWKEELQQYISPDQLPQAYGGTRCEPDPWCTDHVSLPLDVEMICDVYSSLSL